MVFLRFARRTPIAKLGAGQTAVIEGRVVADKTLSVPGSDTRPIYFDMVVETYTTGSRGRGRPMWIPSKAEEQVVPFVIEDESGRAWIAAELPATHMKGGWRQTATTGKKGTSRFVARFIAPGDVVRVRGQVTAARKTEGAPLALRGGERAPLVVLFRRRGQTAS